MPTTESHTPSIRVIESQPLDRPSSSTPKSGSVHNLQPSESWRRIRSPKHIAFAPTKDDGADEELGRSLSLRKSIDKLYKRGIAHHWVAWIPPKLNWTDMKPVIRSAIATWIGFVLMLIQESGKVLGQAAFFVLIVACMIPPSQPVIQTIEIFTNLFFFAGLAWAWVCFGVFLAAQVRVPTNPEIIAAAEAKWASVADNPTLFNARIIFDGTYLQAKPAVISAVFLAVGTGALLWWKMRTAPSPATFPLVLSCILMDVSLSIVPLYPTAYYESALLFLKPMAIQAGIAILVSIVIFPESVAHQFRSRFCKVIDPIYEALSSMETLFAETRNVSPFEGRDGVHLSTLSVDDDNDCDLQDKLKDWADRSDSIRTQLLGSLAGIPVLQAQQRYLAVDISYGRLGGHDLKKLFVMLSQLQVRAGGLAFFFDIIVANARHSHINSAAFNAQDVLHSRPNSRPASIRESSRPSSVRNSIRDSFQQDEGPVDRAASLDMDEESHHDVHHDSLHHELRFSARRLHFPSFHHRSRSPGGINHSHKGSNLSLLDHLRKSQQPVGVYESQRYMDIERTDGQDIGRILEQLELLTVGSLPLVRAIKTGLSVASTWSHTGDTKRNLRALGLDTATSGLQSALDDFREVRLEVIKPYRHLFDPSHPPTQNESLGKVQHKGLFYCFVAQYHLIELSESLLTFLRETERLETIRSNKKLWLPRLSSLLKQFGQNQRDRKDAEHGGEQGDENSFDREEDDILGAARKRNPDYEPFDTPILNLMSRVAILPDLLFSRSAMYAVKAGVLGVLTCLPAFLESTATFYYYNRGIWCTIMAQMTLAVFSGDTFSAWLARLLASFWGCLLGTVVWYIGAGSGTGNPYGLAAICALAFTCEMFFRIHFPGQVLTAVMSTTSMNLVIGYSYLNGNYIQLTNATWGFDVAWLRFVCVVIGITAAWLFCYVPPTYSAKLAIRNSYARGISLTGQILCHIMSAANEPGNHVEESEDTRQELLNSRTKLSKLSARHNNARQEYSIRGRWPEDRYKGLLTTLQDVMSLLAQLNHVLCQLNRSWRRALLMRTRMSDPLFIGDVLAVISMTSTALRAGTPLPQITPGPLIAKYHMGKFKGLDLPLDPADPNDDLPSLVTVDVLESEDYMRYALGVATVFALMSRLDGIVVVCKTLLGENYHISNIHLGESRA